VRDEFLIVAAHELKTPLTALNLQLSSLERTSLFRPECVDKTAQRKLDLAHRQIRRLAVLVENLLEVSRISGGRLKLHPEPFDLGEVAASVVERLQEEATRSGSVVRLSVAGCCHGIWDRLRVDQVVDSLLSNAIKYGQGRPVDVTLSREGRWVVLTVQDRGIGIQEEKQQTIFERFERAVSIQAYGGLGLGLYLTRQIVDAHEGKVSVESQPGAGSSFRVELPAEDDPGVH